MSSPLDAKASPITPDAKSGVGACGNLSSITRISRESGIPCVDLSAFDTWVFDVPRQVASVQLVNSRMLPAIPVRLSHTRVALIIASTEDEKNIHEIFRSQGVECPGFLLATSDCFQKAREQARMGVEEGQSMLGQDVAASPALAKSQERGVQLAPASDFEQADSANTAESASSAAAPAVRLVNRIIGKAISRGASDIHFEPYEDSYRVRLRCDGVLIDCEAPDQALSPAISARIKVMARMDISERRLPQDGRIRLAMSDGRHVDLRVNSLPTLWGEKLVLRILAGSSEARSVQQLGMSDRQRQLFERALGQSQGLILVTGPTGSGKTVTLYAGLKRLNTTERNIVAVEDPVEITLPGVNQVQVNTRVGLDFASALRAFLRQDPDIIMLGEIRDQETAEMAIRAAQTGHIVLATLHTNSALETPGRLIDMGIPPFLLGSALSLVVAQRLVRRLCADCSRDGVPASEGCRRCVGGYSGRQGIYEVLSVTDSLAQAIAKHAQLDELLRIAREEEWLSLYEQGEELVRQGVTSRDELNRVCS